MPAAVPGPVLAAVLGAALLHAGWNAAVKAEPDKLLSASAVTLGALALCFLPAPQAASWPFIAASGALQVAYYLLLAATYRDADISHAYPLMRGSAPVLVALANGGSEALHGAQPAARRCCGSPEG
ncbi:hypothetical protein [Massilia sp. X63]|uniref:hypothetical protein n=1 Tax=Massilia sp. X63 TaxID=3237285 RepID=UPI0034DDC908